MSDILGACDLGMQRLLDSYATGIKFWVLYVENEKMVSRVRPRMKPINSPWTLTYFHPNSHLQCYQNIPRHLQTIYNLIP